MDVKSIKNNCKWLYAIAANDPKNARECPYCGRPAFLRVITEGAYANNPKVVAAHTAMIQMGAEIDVFLALEFCDKAPNPPCLGLATKTGVVLE
jgi:hypothetical protein